MRLLAPPWSLAACFRQILGGGLAEPQCPLKSGAPWRGGRCALCLALPVVTVCDMRMVDSLTLTMGASLGMFWTSDTNGCTYTYCCVGFRGQVCGGSFLHCACDSLAFSAVVVESSGVQDDSYYIFSGFNSTSYNSINSCWTQVQWAEVWKHYLIADFHLLFMSVLTLFFSLFLRIKHLVPLYSNIEKDMTRREW